MELHLWFSLVIVCILGALSPGPSLALVIKNTMNGGVNQGYATAISHGLGVALYAAITATGIALILVQSPLAFEAIQYAGAAFLLYLGFKALTSKKQSIQLDEADESNTSNDVNGWRDGFLIAFLNPKLAIFFLALFSQFVTEEASTQQKVIMTATVGIIDALWYLIVAFTMSRGPIIERLKRNSHIVDKVTGVFLIGLAARVVIT